MNVRSLLPLFFVLILGVCAFAEDVQPMAEEQKLKEIQEKLQTSKKQLNEIKKKEVAALSKLVVTKKKLQQTQKNLNRVNKKIVVNQEELKKLASDLVATHEKLTLKASVFKKRIREVYKSSTVNYLELLFSSTSMADFINRAYFFSKIIDMDASLVQDISTNYSTIKVTRTKLDRSTKEIKELASEIVEQKKEITGQAKEVSMLYDELKERRALYEKQVSELERSSRELENVIIKKIAERKKQNQVITGNTGALDWPLRGRITSNYGYRRHPLWGGRHLHTGIDIAAPHGEAIRSADGGSVILSGWWDGYGKAVVIDHGNNMTTVYGHMSRIYVQVGNDVKKGQIIGLVGSTGYSTGPHLHFEVRVKGKTKDPRKYLP